MPNIYNKNKTKSCKNEYGKTMIHNNNNNNNNDSDDGRSQAALQQQDQPPSMGTCHTREHSREKAKTVPRINDTDGEEERGAQCIMGSHPA